MAFVAQYLVTATSLGQQVEAWLLSPWEREERVWCLTRSSSGIAAIPQQHDAKARPRFGNLAGGQPKSIRDASSPSMRPLKRPKQDIRPASRRPSSILATKLPPNSQTQDWIFSASSSAAESTGFHWDQFEKMAIQINVASFDIALEKSDCLRTHSPCQRIDQ